MQDLNGPVLGKEVGWVLVQGNALSPGPRSLVGIMQAIILHIHPLGLGTTLQLAPIVAPLHLLDDALEDTPALVPFLELVLDPLLILDHDEIPHLPMVHNVQLGLGSGGG